LNQKRGERRERGETGERGERGERAREKERERVLLFARFVICQVCYLPKQPEPYYI
jgi:ribosomal protein L15